MKRIYTKEAIARLSQFFHLTPDTIRHQEAATPRTFAVLQLALRALLAHWSKDTHLGPWFCQSHPVKHLWLVGDSTHPGEGTAVSYSALTVVRQIETD